MEITKSELEIMNVLWSEGRPLTKSEIIELSVNRTWKDCSAHLLLNGLLNKGAIKESGFVKCVKTYGRLYEACISCEEYYTKYEFSRGGRAVLPVLMSALVKSEALNDETIADLKKLIDERYRELEG